MAEACCPSCGADLAGAQAMGKQVRQVIDLPPVVPIVTDHVSYRLRCASLRGRDGGRLRARGQLQVGRSLSVDEPAALARIPSAATATNRAGRQTLRLSVACARTWASPSANR